MGRWRQLAGTTVAVVALLPCTIHGSAFGSRLLGSVFWSWYACDALFLFDCKAHILVLVPSFGFTSVHDSPVDLTALRLYYDVSFSWHLNRMAICEVNLTNKAVSSHAESQGVRNP
jgi:hypothetical protein